MSDKVRATKFLKTEDEAKREWLSLLTDDPHVPIDVAYKATCEIRREYYPYADYDMVCAATWTATSINEHEEEYQVAREETVYIDYCGEEHKTGGCDFENIAGVREPVKRYRQPLSRTVYDTKTRTVVDAVWQSDGDVGPLKLMQRVATCELPSLDWAAHFESNQFIEADEDYLNDYHLMPETVSKADAQERAESESLSDMARYAQRDVPGDRFEDFSLCSFNVRESTRSDFLLGVYHVVYQYEGESYECFLSGGAAEGDYLFGPRPVDDSVKEQSEALDEVLSKNSGCSRKTLFLLAVPVLLIASWLFSLLGFRTPYVAEDYLEYSILGAISISLLIAAVCCGMRFALMQMTSNKMKKEKKQFESDGQLMRKQVLELVQNDAIPEADKKSTIERWLTDHSGNVSMSRDLVVSTIGKQKKQVRLLNMVTIAAIAVVLAFGIISGIVASSNHIAEEEQIEAERQYRYENHFSGGEDDSSVDLQYQP